MKLSSYLLYVHGSVIDYLGPVKYLLKMKALIKNLLKCDFKRDQVCFSQGSTCFYYDDFIHCSIRG